MSKWISFCNFCVWKRFGCWVSALKQINKLGIDSISLCWMLSEYVIPDIIDMIWGYSCQNQRKKTSISVFWSFFEWNFWFWLRYIEWMLYNIYDISLSNRFCCVSSHFITWLMANVQPYGVHTMAYFFQSSTPIPMPSVFVDCNRRQNFIIQIPFSLRNEFDGYAFQFPLD